MSAGSVLGFPLGECVAKFDQAAVQSAFSSQLLYTHEGTNNALYRITWYACLTQAATSSSWIGGINGFQVNYNPAETGTSVTSPAAPLATGQYNTVGTTIGSGITMAQVIPGTKISFNFGYTSSGATPAQYTMHIRVEYMGDTSKFAS